MCTSICKALEFKSHERKEPAPKKLVVEGGPPTLAKQVFAQRPCTLWQGFLAMLSQMRGGVQSIDALSREKMQNIKRSSVMETCGNMLNVLGNMLTMLTVIQAYPLGISVYLSEVALSGTHTSGTHVDSRLGDIHLTDAEQNRCVLQRFAKTHCLPNGAGMHKCTGFGLKHMWLPFVS